MCPSLIYSPFPVPFHFPLGGTWSKTAPLSPDFSGKELIVQPVSQMWCDLAPLMKVSNVLQFPVPKLGYNPTALSESITWTFWKAFLCIVSILWPPFIWIHCSLHYRGAWHPDLNTPQGILPSSHLDTTHNTIRNVFCGFSNTFGSILLLWLGCDFMAMHVDATEACL